MQHSVAPVHVAPPHLAPESAQDVGAGVGSSVVGMGDGTGVGEGVLQAQPSSSLHEVRHWL